MPQPVTRPPVPGPGIPNPNRPPRRRKRVKGLPQATPLGLNLAPMVDVVMCLIIFFMLATKLVERENSSIDLPAASTAKEKEKRDIGRRVVINVLRDEIGAEPAAQYVISERPMSLSQVAQRLAAERQRDPQVRCVIRGDRELPYRHIEAVLLACARNGISNVVFAAARETEGRSR